MVRSVPSRSPRSVAELFAADPVAAVLDVLREAGEPAGLRADEIKARLRAGGVTEDRLRKWRGVQVRLVAHERVQTGGDRYRRTYRYVPEPPRPGPAQALAMLAAARLPAPRRAELVEIVRAALGGASGDGSRVRVASLEQREKDIVRALAEMAIEVEELAVNEASSRALVHTVRALTKRAELRPIERAGETVRFDRSRHASVGGRIADGAPVLVLRPGYVWNRQDEEILIARAVVQDRSPQT